MLVTLWSPKGGSGTSVVAAAFASVLARHHGGVRLVDLCGDQPAVCGVTGALGRGAGDWLAAGPTTPAAALETFEIDADRFALVPVGDVDPATASDAAGAAFAVVLRDEPRISVVDAGPALISAAPPLVELADLSLVVMRACYLAFQRTRGREHLLRVTSGVLLVDEPHRQLRVRDVAEIVDLPVLGVVPCVPDIARAVDAGVVLQRGPEQLFRPIADTLRRLGLGPRPLRAA